MVYNPLGMSNCSIRVLKKKSAATAQPAATKNPNGFANFKQTDMSNQLDKLEQMLADELNLDKR